MLPIAVFSQTRQSTDFTAEHLFTNNIEGPCFYQGVLYVVNYQQDGAIGAVQSDGSVMLFTPCQPAVLLMRFNLIRRATCYWLTLQATIF